MIARYSRWISWQAWIQDERLKQHPWTTSLTSTLGGQSSKPQGILNMWRSHAELKSCPFRQTLLHDPNSMLARMFDPVSPLCPGEHNSSSGVSLAFFVCQQLFLFSFHKSYFPGVRRDGAYFLDRDPIYFRPVLNYLRSGQLSLDRWESGIQWQLRRRISEWLNLLRGCNIPALLSEASFFGLSGLEAALQVTQYFAKIILP